MLVNQAKGTTNKVKILPLGDSITIGYPYTYRYDLFHLLSDAGYPFTFVGSLNNNPAGYRGVWDQNHEGHSGWTTLQIDVELKTWLKDYTPGITLIHLGTNDATAIKEGFLSLEESETAMRSIIEKLRISNPAMHIYLAQIIPFGSTADVNYSSYNPIVQEWNLLLESMASDLSTRESQVTILDMNTGFENADLDDGVHPSPTGAAKMASIWAEAILE